MYVFQDDFCFLEKGRRVKVFVSLLQKEPIIQSFDSAIYFVCGYRHKVWLKNHIYKRGRDYMLEILKEWGPVIIAAAAIVFILTLVQSDAIQSAVTSAFENIITGMSEKTGLITK